MSDGKQVSDEIKELALSAEIEVLKARVHQLDREANSRLTKIARRLGSKLKGKSVQPSIDATTIKEITDLQLFDSVFYVHRYPEILSTGLEPFQHYLNFGGRERKDPNGLFDTTYYLSQVANPGDIENALVHYVRRGAKMKLNPNRLFDTTYYLIQNEDAAENPLAHFRGSGAESRSNPTPLFDIAYYLANNDDVRESSINPLEHYLLSGTFEGRNPNLFFDTKAYQTQAGLESKPLFYVRDFRDTENVALFFAQASIFLRREQKLQNPLFHYLDSGEASGLSPHPLFSPLYYTTANKTANASPLRHFLEAGRHNNFNTHPLFDAQYYFENNKDVKDSGIDALSHYLSSGFREKRCPHPLFDARYYLENNSDVKETGANPLIHFLQIGAKEYRNPNKDFDIRFYVGEYGARIQEGLNPLEHYITTGKLEGFHPAPPEPSLDVELEDVDPATLRFPIYGGNVLVSVVIPSYKQNDFTLRCLKSLASHQSRYQFEVIVVDDCSPDDTEAKLSRIEGLRYFKNEVNKGFVMTCNRGIQEARGEFIALLNNDTIVLDSWLDELIDTFYTHPNAGLVGSKLIYPDGALQDAGSIVYSDGDAANFGKDDQADKPEYNYVRSVDYCTGAGLAIRRELFLKVGGFGEEYRPIYWEDVDLAFKVREAGFDVLYQPFSVVIHFEGVTCGRNTSSGLKQSQVINQKKFGERWKHELAAQPTHTSKPYVEWNRDNRKKVLFVTCLTPQADRDAGSTLTIEWLQTFKDLNYDVTFFPTSLSHEGRYTEYLQKMGVKCIYHPFVKKADDFFAALKDEYDLVVICRIEVFDEYFDSIKKQCPSAKFVFQTIDLHYLRTKREAETLSSDALMLESNKLKKQELAAIEAADVSIVVSPYEVDVLNQALNKPRVLCIPFSTQLNRLDTPFKDRRDLVFVGGYGHQPNADAVVYFVEQIFPIVKRVFPEIRFFIIGGGATKEVKELACFDVVVTGMVEDLTRYLRFARLSVAPLRFGAGLKGKILSSLGAGLPCVTSLLGVEGTGLTADENILVADSADEFASKVIELYSNEELWNRLSDTGYDFVDKNFSPQKISNDIKEMLVRLKIETASVNNALATH